MAERKLSLVILGKATGALAAMKSVGDEAGGLGKKITDLLPSFKTVALAGAAAFGAVAASAYGAVQAAAQDELSRKKLSDQIKRTTQANDEQIASVEKFISSQMFLTGVTDDELRPAFANLLRATGDLTASQQALILAQDIAAATGKDLESVSLSLGKAFNGNIGALTKLGIPLDETAKKSKNLTELTKSLQEQFGGAAADSADTFSGRLKILQVSLGEAVESIGYALLPFAERLVAFIQAHVVPVIQAFSDELAGGGGLRDALLAAAGQMGTFGLQVIDIVENIALAFTAFGNAVVAIGKPILVVVGNIAAGLTLLFTGSLGKADAMFRQFETAYLALDKVKISTDGVTAAFARFRGEVVALQNYNSAIATTDHLSRRYGKTTEETTSRQDDFLKVLRELQAGAGGAGKKVEEIADKMKKFGDVVEKARDATRSAADATKGVQKAQSDLTAKTDAVTAAQARFDTVVRGFPASARESIDASRRFADAQRGVRDAGLQVADAVRGVAQAEKALADLRARAADAQKVAGAERALERSKYGVEEANFRVTDAERALAEIRLDPEASAVEIRRAEIDLAEAKLAVFDAVQSVRDAEQRLAEQRDVAATPDEIAEAERNLERAKYAVTDAIDAQTRATSEQADAQQHLNEITFGAAVGSLAYNAALKELTDAKQDQKEASESLADALRSEADAVRELAAAQKALAAAQAAIKPAKAARIAAGLGVTIGAGGTIVENIAAVSANSGAASASAGATNVTLNVQAGISNPVETANEILDALKQWERSNGSLNLFVPQ